MSNEPKETGRLEGDVARRQARIILLEKLNKQLEEENDRLKALNKALKVQKDPEQKLIPWDKAKQDLYIQQLEEALRFYANEKRYYVQNTLGAWDFGYSVLDDRGRVARAALSSSASEEAEGE